MKAHSDEEPDIVGQREKIIGLGELSIRKSYYPELQQKHAELLKKNEELLAAYEELTATDEELRQQYEEISKKEHELRESESRLRGVANNIPGIVYQFYARPTGEMGMYYVSERSAEILGIDNSPGDFFSRFTACVVPAERERFLASIDTAVRNVSSWNWEGRFIRPDGREMYIRGISEPVKMDNELVFSGVLLDISERKKAEAALSDSENFLNSVFENIPDMIFVKDARDLRFVRFNKAGEDLLGFSREELYGKNDYDLFPKDEADFFTGNDREVLKNQQVVNIPEERIQTRLKGERILHTKKISIPDESGKPCYLMGISEDITDRKRAEEIVRINQERLEKSQPLGHVGSWEFDPVAGKIWGSDEGFRIYGMIPPENNDLPIETIEACIPERKKIHQALVDLLERDIPYNLEFAINPADGSPQRVITSIAEVVRDDEGRILKVAGVIQDITERKRMENALQLARNKINLLNAVTIQDIQAAAFSLTAYHELIRGRVTDAKAKAFLEKETALNQKIIDSLNFAKNYQDMGVKPPRWQNIRQVFLFAISHLDFLHITHNLHVEDLEVYADPLLETVFFNLMENVLLHGEHASEVTIRYQEKVDGLVLFIEDNGVGIPAEEKQMIFDRGHGKNTGLGLFLAREVLSITGMTIKETGEPGRGARFEILVPKENYRFTGEQKTP
jgi:PAS domain S-box-containing protein